MVQAILATQKENSMNTSLPKPVPDTASGIDTHADFTDEPHESRTLFNRMLRSAFGTAILQGMSNGLSFVTAVLLARLLGKDGYGIYAFAFAWASFLIIPALAGFDQFLVRGMARYDIQKNLQHMKGLLRRANQIVLFTSTTIAGIGCIISLTLLSSSLRAPLCVAMLLLPITSLTLLRQGAMQAIGRIVTGQFPEYIVGPLLMLAGLGILIWVGGGALTPTTALGAYVVGTAIAFVVGAILLKRSLPVTLRSVSPSYETRKWIKTSLPIMMINGVWTANRYLGIIILGTLASTSDTGVYNAVERGAAVILLVHLAVNMPLAPAIARLYAQGDLAGVERASEQMARTSTLVSLPICLAFAIFPQVYLSLYGAGFGAGATAMTILALAQLVNAATGPSGNVLIMTGNQRPAMWATAAGLLVNLTLGIVLVPSLGITGSAIAFASSIVFWNITLTVLGRRQVGVNVTAVHLLSMKGSRRVTRQ
jgi:O-antigen/teichoic acid export membrane protein